MSLAGRFQTWSGPFLFVCAYVCFTFTTAFCDTPPPSSKEQLDALGYLASTFRPAPAAEVPVYCDHRKAQPGLTLYASGHAPEAYLIDLDGKVLHTWHGDPNEVAPGAREALPGFARQIWRRVALLPGGALLAIYENVGLAKIDKDSKVIWWCRDRFHHDLEVQPDGTIYALTRRDSVIPRFNAKEPTTEDFIVVVSLDGKLLREVSILDALDNSDYAPLFRGRLKKSGDVLHVNTVEVLSGNLAKLNPAFKAGNVLISMRELDAVAVVDLAQRKVVWALTGLWVGQHQPTMLASGNMLVFDNQGLAASKLAEGKYSRVLELNPFSQQIVWRYEGSKARPFYSKYGGSCQRLADGNTLISESDGGRAFEVDPQGNTVWELQNPHRCGANGEYIAAMVEAIRLPQTYNTDWLRKP